MKDRAPNAIVASIRSSLIGGGKSSLGHTLLKSQKSISAFMSLSISAFIWIVSSEGKCR